MKHWVKGGHDYYYNLKSKEGTWAEPEGFAQSNTQLDKDDVQVGSRWDGGWRRGARVGGWREAHRHQTKGFFFYFFFLLPLLSRWFLG